MNYRHAFHAGNFADLLKHAILTCALRHLTASGPPLTVIDTHAGAGLYDLGGALSRRTGEAEAGIVRLMDDPSAPDAFDLLKASVVRRNDRDSSRFYPGSPVLIVGALRPRDRYIACELRPDDFAALQQALPQSRHGCALMVDGWQHAARIAPASPNPLLVLIDPPFELGDDHAHAVALLETVLSRNARACVAIWTPIKDLATFDTFLGDLEDVSAGVTLLVAEVRLRPLSDPMRLNGCAMVVANPTPGLDTSARQATGWIATMIGEAGGEGRVLSLGAPP